MLKKNKKMFLKWKQLFCTLIVVALLVSGITPAFAAQQTAASAVSAAQVTDIRVLADGQEVSMEKPLEVHGYHKGTVTVQAKTQGSDQFVNIPSIWDAKLKWISGNGEIRGNGIFEIMGTGEAVFSATYGGITKQFKVISKNVDVKSIRVNVPATWDIHDWNSLGGYYVGITKGNGPRQYSYVVEPGNASDKSLVWESLTPDVAEFMEAFGNGIVPKKAGTARFKVSSKSNPEVSQEVSVNFVYRHPLKSATPGKAEYTIEEGGFQDIVINTVPAEASEQRFNWEYSEPGIVEIQDGITTNPDSVTIPKKTTHTMTALKSGEVTVTGTPFDTTSGCAPVTFTVTVTKDGVAPGVGDLVALAKENIKRGVAYLKTQSMTKYNDEWNMFTVLRSGGEVSQQVKDQYYASVCAKLKGGFDGLKNTDAARVSITLAAMGKDLTNVDGMDLMAGFYNDQYKFKLANDTSNGPIWALIALDCQKAEIPDTAKWNRDKLIEQILKFQKKDGGFGLNLGDNVTSVDMTGMAMQALAPYNDAKHPAVQSAFNKGLEYLKSKITAKAGYADMDGGKENSCSAAQVLTALAAAGIDPTNAENGFTKGKHNIVKNLDSFKSGDGYSLYAGGKADVMSTQQVTYAMEAYVRLVEGGNRLYDLTDVPKEVTADQRAADAVIKAIDAIGKVTLESKEAIQNARNAYDALTEIQKGLVTNLAVLEKAESELKALEEQNSGKEVIVAIEKFSIGRGYHMEPVKVTIGKEATPKEILKKAAGASYKEGMFSRFKGLEDPELKQDNITVPAYISEKLGGPTTAKAIEYAKKQSSWDTILGEDDYAKYSKWVCMINNKVVKSDAYAEPTLDKKVNVKAGDVIRFQFSIAEGQDIDGYKIWEPETKLIDISNKDALTKLMADVNATEAKKNPVVKAAYDDAVKVLANAVTPQKDVDAAEAKLRLAVENPQALEDQMVADKVIKQIDAIGEVTLESKAAIEAARKAYDALTEPQKALVTNLDKLTKAEADLKDLLTKPAGYAYISVDKATLGQGYLVEPVKVPFFAGENAAQVLNRALEMNGFKLDYTGSLEDSFYMSAITNAGGNLKAEFPAYLQKYITDNGVSVMNPRESESLGEFDYTSYSGWVFKYDNLHSPVGAAGVECKDGMTFRWAFTVCGLGSDCWDTGWGDPIVPYAVNKDALIKTVADFKARSDYEELMKTKTMKDAYAAILKVGTDNEIDQTAIDQAIADFERAIKFELMYIKEAAEVDAKIAAIGEVTLESESAITDARIAYATLSEGAQARVTKLADLETAEKKLADLKTAEDKKAAAVVDSKIDAIGTVTLGSKAAIEEARAAYDALTAAQQKHVTKLSALESAEKKYAELKAEADKLAEDKKAAAVVDSKIDAIGDVTLDSKAAIEKARAAYDALTAAQQKHVTKLPALESAEKKYSELKAEADKLAADKKAAAEVDALIDAIGDVTLDSIDKINAATDAYNKLTNDQKAHVIGLDKLNAAVEKYNELKAEADKPAVKPEEDKTPSTGDENAVLLYGLAMLVAAGTAYAARRKYNR